MTVLKNKENTFTEQNRFLVYSDQLNATRKQILDASEEMVSRSAIQTFEDEGETITATDASYLAGLTIDGKAVQDGTPTPNDPVPIEFVGLNDDNEFGIQIGETLYPINLQGNVLASLPNSTKDVLTVDSVGHCVLNKRVKTITSFPSFSKIESVTYTTADYLVVQSQYSNAGSNVFSDMKVPPNGTSINGLFNYFEIDVPSSANLKSKPLFGITSNGTSLSYIWFVVPKSIASTVQEFNTWFNALPDIVFCYELATPQTVDLGYIDMPAIPEGSTISITAQVTPTIAAKWWTKNQSDVAAAFGAVSSDFAALQNAISALDVRVTALENSNRSSVLEKTEIAKELAREPEETDEQEEMNFDDE